VLIFPRFKFAGAFAGTEAFIKLFCTAFAFGFTWKSLPSEGAKWAERPKQKANE